MLFRSIRVLDRLAGDTLSKNKQFQSEVDRLRPELDYDAIFGNKLRNRKVVMGYTFNKENEKKGQLPAPALKSVSPEKSAGRSPCAIKQTWQKV